MDKILPLLAVETTGELCSTALLFDENSFVEMNYLQKHIHSQKLVEMVDAVLKAADFRINNLKAIAISVGPGSFTGIRIGFSAVKGLAFGAELPVVQVPTYDALAFQLGRNLKADTKFVIANKASMNELYVSKNITAENGYAVIEQVRLISQDEFSEFCNDVELVFGNYTGKPVNLNASSVGRWAYLFGKDLLTFDYDYLEPEYFGNPFLKKKTK